MLPWIPLPDCRVDNYLPRARSKPILIVRWRLSVELATACVDR
jgi:hypothetical protein